ncbi:MAG TPA: ATP-binding protein [Polyangia bacterium]|nr:ATP-binding protein [Polyangia bacterium]
MTFRAKLLMIVGAMALGLILVIVLSALIGLRETRDLTAIEGRLLPRLALGPELQSDFERLGRSMQDAVAAQDLGALEEARPMMEEISRRLASVPGAVDAAQAALLRDKVEEYYRDAQALSRRLIAQETGEEMIDAMDAMQVKQRAAAEALQHATSLDLRQLSDHFAAIHAARATATRARWAVSMACLVVVLLLSIRFSRRVLGVINDLSLGFARFGGGDLGRPIPITTDDELGRLAAEANQMAERLSATLSRLADTSAQLAHANGELQAFSYSVAHDLRAPLRGIRAFAQMFLDVARDKLDSDAQDWLQEILSNASKMSALIDALLTLSRVTRTELRAELVDVGDLARAAGAGLAAAEPARVVELVVQDGLGVKADPHLARALIDNLMANAWKFTSKEAHPRVEVGSVEVAGARAFFVRDNGAGFDMAFASKLFAPFQRLHSAADYPGTGIGLATVQRIANRHGGRAWANGEVNRGATFYFTLAASRIAT